MQVSAYPLPQWRDLNLWTHFQRENILSFFFKNIFIYNNYCFKYNWSICISVLNFSCSCFFNKLSRCVYDNIKLYVNFSFQNKEVELKMLFHLNLKLCTPYTFQKNLIVCYMFFVFKHSEVVVMMQLPRNWIITFFNY